MSLPGQLVEGAQDSLGSSTSEEGRVCFSWSHPIKRQRFAQIVRVHDLEGLPLPTPLRMQPLHLTRLVRIRARPKEEDQSPPRLAPWLPPPPGPRGQGFSVRLLRCLFFTRTGSLLLSSLSERARGLQAGTQRGIREKPLGPQSNPSNSRPAASTSPFPLNSPSSCCGPPGPLQLMSPVMLGSKENPRPWGASGGTPQTLGKGQRPPPRTQPRCVKTQQVAVAWRKVAFVALSEPQPSF